MEILNVETSIPIDQEEDDSPLPQKRLPPWLTSYSAWNSFRGCQEGFRWQYIEGIIPAERPEPLEFGILIHQLLEAGADWKKLLGQWLLGNESDEAKRLMMWKAKALMSGYTMDPPGAWVRDPSDEAGRPSNVWRLSEKIPDGREGYSAMSGGYRVVCDEDGKPLIERWFTAPIVNPRSNRASRTVMLRGRIDTVVEDMDGGRWVMEHKSADPGFIQGYLDPRWYDLQSAVYVHAVYQCFGIQVQGVIHNLLLKSKSHRGWSNAKSVYTETVDEFGERLVAEYTGSKRWTKYLRVQKPITMDQVCNVLAEIWGMSRLFREAMSSGIWVRDTSQCYNRFGRVCEYFPLCWGDESNPNYWEKFVRIPGMKRAVIE